MRIQQANKVRDNYRYLLRICSVCYFHAQETFIENAISKSFHVYCKEENLKNQKIQI